MATVVQVKVRVQVKKNERYGSPDSLLPLTCTCTSLSGAPCLSQFSPFQFEPGSEFVRRLVHSAVQFIR